MLVTVLKVLSIIGIILLVILAVAIVLILFVLLAPLNYKFIVKYNRDNGQSNICFLKLNWLSYIVRLRIDIGLKGIEYELRLFGFKSRLLDKYLGDKSDNDDYDEEYEKESVSQISRNKNKDNQDIDDGNYEDYEDLSTCVPINNDEEISLLTKNMSMRQDDEDDDLLEEIDEIWEDLVSEVEYDAEDTKPKFSFKKIFKTNPIKAIIKFIKLIIKRVKGLILAITKTINVLINKYELVVELWEKKSTRIAIERIIKYINQLCKHIKPNKTKIKLEYGFDDPALTGQVLGGIGIMYSFVGEVVEVNPDFEESKLALDCYISGRMRILNLGIIIIKVVRDKAIKRLLSNIDKLKEELNNVR